MHVRNRISDKRCEMCDWKGDEVIEDFKNWELRSFLNFS